jgi:cyanophycinase
MRTLGRTLVIALACLSLSAAPKPKFEYYLTGDAADRTATTEFGLGLMGGGTDIDALFTWMSDRAGGGDFVVIRASGADGYNQYVYDLGDFDSVETLVLPNRDVSSHAFVLQTIRNAEALFIAGGDQSDYVNYWKDTPVEDEIHALIARGVPVAGTSAGTAILGELLYSAQRKSVTSAQALADPFDRNITLDRDFLVVPGMADIITDQHFVERDRMGRTLAFMARLATDGGVPDIRAIAIDRETAVLIDADGLATVIANAGHETPHVYLLTGGDPQIVQPKTPLTFVGVQVQRLAAGGSFNFADWTAAGSTTYQLNVNAGVVASTQPGGAIY